MRADEQDIEARLAAQLVRKVCCQHTCAGAQCVDPNHRRDENFVRDQLQMLGLGENLTPVSTEERHKWIETYTKGRE